MSIDLCYIVSHGFASRMIMQTDLLGQLRTHGLNVAVITPDARDPVLSAYCQRHSIELVEFRFKVGLFSDDYLFKRRYYLEDIRANAALWEKHLAATRFHRARNPLKRLRPHWYYLMYRMIKRFPGIRERFLRREVARLNSPAAEALLKRLRPRKLVSTYPINISEAVLLRHANADPSIETWIHLLSWDNITCKGRFPETAEQYIAWGPVMRDELQANYGVSPERIHVCGVPHFDIHRDPAAVSLRPEVLRALGLDPTIPYLLFAMSSPRFAPNEIEIVEWLASAVVTGAFGKLQLLIRPHPQNVSGNMADASWLPRLKALTAKCGVGLALPKMAQSRLNWSMEQVDMLELAAMLSGAAVILNSGSTVSIDALMHGKPVLVTAFDGDCQRDYWDSARRLMDYPHLKKLWELGGMRVTTDFADLESAIRDTLLRPNADAELRTRALTAECLTDDGHATQRVIRVFSPA